MTGGIAHDKPRFAETSMSLDRCLMSVCESVVNSPLPCEPHACFQKFQISAPDFTHEFLTMVTKGVVYGVHKDVIWSSFGVIWRQNMS